MLNKYVWMKEMSEERYNSEWLFTIICYACGCIFSQWCCQNWWNYEFRKIPSDLTHYVTPSDPHQLHFSEATMIPKHCQCMWTDTGTPSVMDWPPRSAYLNIIVWDRLDRKEQKVANIQTRVCNVPEEAWRTTTEDYFMKFKDTSGYFEEWRESYQILTCRVAQSIFVLYAVFPCMLAQLFEQITAAISHFPSRK